MYSLNRKEEPKLLSKYSQTIDNFENEDLFNLDIRIPNSEDGEDRSESNNSDLSQSNDHKLEINNLIIYKPTGSTIYDSDESLL